MEVNATLNMSMRRRVLKLAVPSILENLLLSMVEYMDTAMVGTMGPLATAAVAVNSPVTWLFNATILAVSVGGTVAVAQSIGAGNNEKAGKLTDQAFLAVCCFSVAVTAGLLLLSAYIPSWMGAEPDIVDSSISYMRIIALGMPFSFITIVFNGILRGAGDTKTPMFLNILTNICNVAGNFLLIFPSRDISVGGTTIHMWGAGWGIDGAAISTTLSRVLAGALIIMVMLRQPVVRLTLSSLAPNRALTQEILRIGVPSALERLSISGGQIVYFRVVSGLGTACLAAHQLANTAESIAYMPAFGFQIAATTLVGQYVGAKDYKGARESGRTTFYLCAICIAGFSALLYFGAEFLIGLFTPSAEVVREGAAALRIMAVAEVFSASASVYTGALRGAGDTKQPFFVSLVSMWGIRLPAALLFVKVLNLGLPGAWYAMAMDLVIRGVLMALRFHRGSWEARLRHHEFLHE